MCGCLWDVKLDVFVARYSLPPVTLLTRARAFSCCQVLEVVCDHSA
jgi:hypothetical protein